MPVRRPVPANKLDHSPRSVDQPHHACQTADRPRERPHPTVAASKRHPTAHRGSDRRCHSRYTIVNDSRMSLRSCGAFVRPELTAMPLVRSFEDSRKLYAGPRRFSDLGSTVVRRLPRCRRPRGRCSVGEFHLRRECDSSFLFGGGLAGLIDMPERNGMVSDRAVAGEGAAGRRRRSSDHPMQCS